jgi:hypothetical protein
MPLERLVLLAHARWVIEQFYEDAKPDARHVKSTLARCSGAQACQGSIDPRQAAMAKTFARELVELQSAR